MKTYYVYMMAKKNNNVLYVGMTNTILRRTREDKESVNNGFTKRDNQAKLVWYREVKNLREAIETEKRLVVRYPLEKNRKQRYREDLIARTNPGWQDLFYAL